MIPIINLFIKEGTMSARKDEINSFWDLDRLLPAKKSRPTSAVQPVDLPLIEIDDVQPSNERTTSQIQIIPPSETKQPSPAPETDEDTWCMQSSLIKRIVIRKWKTSFNYYEDFYADAFRFVNANGVPVPAASFFSYVPQYSQLTASQLRWYLYWRTQLRDNGIALPTDESYVTLYLYEIINLSDRIDPQTGLSQILTVWKNYHEKYPGINKYVSEWLVDYCFIHHLTPSVQDLTFVTPDMTASCSIKEFYLHFDPTDISGFSLFLMQYASSYQYKQSKYYTNENKALYDLHVNAVIVLLLSDELLFQKINHCLNVHTVKVIRDAYVGALCSCSNKRKLEIEYVSFSRSHEVKYFIGDVVKYTENQIRSYLGIKSRLSIYSLPDDVKKTLDNYFERYLPHEKRKQQAPQPAYESLYDLPEKALSLSDAKNIENDSWDTTDKLLTSMTLPNVQEDLSMTRAETVVPHFACDVQQTAKAPNAILTHKEFVLYLISSEKSKALEYCSKRQLLFDSVVNAINEACVDVFGDVIFEEGRFIEEYHTDVMKYYQSFD